MKRSSDWWYERQVGTEEQAPIEPEYRVLAEPPGSVCSALAAVHLRLDNLLLGGLADTSNRFPNPGMSLPFSMSVMAILLPAFI
jgi:hypothetical protein